MGKTYQLGPRVEFEAIPTGDYAMRLMNWKEVVRDADFMSHKKGEIQIELTWEVYVTATDTETRRTFLEIPKTFSKKANFVKVAVALQLVDEADAIERGCIIDWDQALGRQCTGTIVCKAKQSDPNELTDRIEGYSVLRQSRNGRRSAAAATTVPAHAAHALDEDDNVPF